MLFVNAELLVEQPLTVLVYPVNLEYLFCQIYADCRSLHGGRLSHQWERTFSTLALQMPFWVGATIPLTTPQSGGIHRGNASLQTEATLVQRVSLI